MATSSALTFVDRQTVISVSWAQTVNDVVFGAVNPTDPTFGCAGDGVTNDTAGFLAALVAAAAVGTWVDGGGRTYGISGFLNLPTVTRIRNAKFIQLAPTTNNCRTLYQGAGSLCLLRDVVVNRNGSGAAGTISDYAGIFIANVTRVEMENVEVYGNDFGNGIVIADFGNAWLKHAYVHDIRGGTAATGAITDDTVQGIWLIRGSRALIEAAFIDNLTNQWTAQAEINRFTRGIVVSGTVDVTITDPQINYVDQGIDITGNENPRRFSVSGGNVRQCYSWGYKAANSAVEGVFSSCLAWRCGLGGFVASAPSSIIAAPTQNIEYQGCLAIETGYGGVWTAVASVCGFRTETSGAYTDYPRGVRWRGCRANANGAVMEYGFFNETALGGSGDVWVEAIDCSVSGATLQDYFGINQGVAIRSRSANFSVTPTGAWNDISWDNTIIDRMLTSTANAWEFRMLRSGVYNVLASLEFAAAAAAVRGVRLLQNGSVVAGSESIIPSVAGSIVAVNLSACVACDKLDILVVQGFQDSGGALDINDKSGVSITMVFSGQGRS